LAGDFSSEDLESRLDYGLLGKDYPPIRGFSFSKNLDKSVTNSNPASTSSFASLIVLADSRTPEYNNFFHFINEPRELKERTIAKG